MSRKCTRGKIRDFGNFLGESANVIKCLVFNGCFRKLNQEETERVFKTYRRGYDLALSREQLNYEDDVLNAAANANIGEEPAQDEILNQDENNGAFEEEEPEPDEILNGAVGAI